MVAGRILVVFLFGLILFLPARLPAQSPVEQGVKPASGFTWRLSNARIVKPGQTMEATEGTIISGYTIRADAQAEGSAPIPQGRFTVTLTIFSPRQDMPGQKAGFWYLRGDWSLAGLDVDPASLKKRHLRDAYHGTLVAELPFNPTVAPGTIEASVKIAPIGPSGTRSRGSKGKVLGKGKFLGNEKFEGIFTP